MGPCVRASRRPSYDPRVMLAPRDGLAEFGIPPLARHDALGDAFAAAQLLLVALAEAKRQGLAAVEDLRGLERNRRFL